MIITLPVALLFFGLVALFVLASIWVDKRFLFFHFDSSWCTLGLSVPLLVFGWLICSWPLLAFLRTRGTPVPFNPPPRLITTGPYAYIRNPMLLGLFIFLLGLGVLFGSLSLVFVFTPLFILINVLYLKAIEGKEMEKKFGEQYLGYKKKVPVFLPKL
ncbi:methyltransferase family protein [Chloroflexota bacterium]